MKVTLQIDHRHDEALLQQWAPAIGPSGWVMLESYAELVFREWLPGSPIPDHPDVFAGRLFGPHAEIRWTRENGVFNIWRMSDTTDEHAAGTPVTAQPRSYYGWAWVEKDGRLLDPRLHRTPQYPLPAAGLRKNDRARFTVVEYYKEAPDRSPANLEEAEQWLNDPRFLAYRLQSFDFHQGEN